MNSNMSAADALASIDDAVWFIGMALGENSSGAARLSQARATFAAMVADNEALRSALQRIASPTLKPSARMHIARAALSEPAP